MVPSESVFAVSMSTVPPFASAQYAFRLPRGRFKMTRPPSFATFVLSRLPQIVRVLIFWRAQAFDLYGTFVQRCWLKHAFHGYVSCLAYLGCECACTGAEKRNRDRDRDACLQLWTQLLGSSWFWGQGLDRGEEGQLFTLDLIAGYLCGLACASYVYIQMCDTHAHIPWHMHAHTHNIRIPLHSHTRTHIHTLTNRHTHKHSRVIILIQTLYWKYIYMRLHRYIQILIYTGIRATWYIFTHTHTLPHTHTLSHTYSCSLRYALWYTLSHTHTYRLGYRSINSEYTEWEWYACMSTRPWRSWRFRSFIMYDTAGLHSNRTISIPSPPIYSTLTPPLVTADINRVSVL